MTNDLQKTTIEYDDHYVRLFMLASVLWGAVGMLAGVFIAFQLNFHVLSFNMEWLTFGRLRPLHTNAAIFAFVGNMMFAGIYYSTQRLCKCRTASDLLTGIHFWGWQLIIVAAAITLPLGLTQSKEYAELIWPIDIAVVIVWVVFAINFFWTLLKRNEPSIYVAIWFYIATIVTVAMLYVVNNLQLPTSLTHSYSIFGGAQDALVQWWYGHNAVAFFLTTPILGIMYYFIPKAAERPVYSYRLSVIHFWSLVFIYIWAGPHHLLNTALPHWLQALGMLFSLMLWAPSWGGMLNGLLTLRGAWHKVWQDPVLKFLVAGVTFYGMATFEGPLLSIRAVNTLSHYSDWTIGHVHSGTLGWNGFMAAGMFYWLAPRLWGTKLYSVQLANMHFWLGLVGILLYVAAMWFSGIAQGLNLNAITENGSLVYPAFVETLERIRPAMLFRGIGGALYLVAYLIGVYNLVMTVRSGKAVNGVQEVYVENVSKEDHLGLKKTFVNAPFIYCSIVTLTVCLWLFGNDFIKVVGLFTTIFFSVMAIAHFQLSGAKWIDWYEKLLHNSIPFTILVIISVAIGGMVQIIPTLMVDKEEYSEDRIMEPYSPLELAGRDIYVSEGCYNCHSQMIRTLLPDVLRYSDPSDPTATYSRLGESIYDHPFQWGSKRTGPDLAREGGKRSDLWHYRHMENPQAIEEKSNMPSYAHMLDKDVNKQELVGKIQAMKILGVPYDANLKGDAVIALYDKEATERATALFKAQLEEIHDDWTPAEIDKKAAELAEVEKDRQIIALIAYLQRLGKARVISTDVAGETPTNPTTN